MLVKIISGTYGHRVGSKIEPKDKNSKPFELDDSEAKRIVALGVAEIVTGGVATPEKPQNASGTNSNPPENENGSNSENEGGNDKPFNLDAEQLDGMTIKELKKLAEDMGIDTSKMKKKADYITAICEVEIGVDDGEAPPDLGAEGPVV